jgi:hypothetical protein
VRAPIAFLTLLRSLSPEEIKTLDRDLCVITGELSKGEHRGLTTIALFPPVPDPPGYERVGDYL